MAFRLIYHPDVHRIDIRNINTNLQMRIMRAIEERLVKEPQSYGEPLRRTLKGYWKLRVGDYRIVFKVVSEEIWICAIIDRKDVYPQVMKRITKNLNL